MEEWRYIEGFDNRPKIHRLVSKYFLINFNNYKEINHIDGNKENNNVTNLEWCTRSQNIKHAYDNNLRKIPKGEINANSKLTDNQVEDIIKLLKSNTVREIANRFNVTWECINNIKLNKSWTHIKRYGKIKLNDEHKVKYKHSDETKNKMSEIRLLNKYTAKSIICINDSREFLSIREASIFYDIDPSSIVKVCKGKQRTVKNLKFRYTKG